MTVMERDSYRWSSSPRSKNGKGFHEERVSVSERPILGEELRVCPILYFWSSVTDGKPTIVLSVYFNYYLLTANWSVTPL